MSDMKRKPFSAEYHKLRSRLAQTGYICTGSVATVYRKCGKPTCVCARDEEALHGPYNTWTRKVKGKTVTRNLTNEQAQLCRESIRNLRALEALIDEMKRMTAEHIEELRNMRRH